jgi:hypothetical protein
MTKLLELAIERLRNLPDQMQDTAARALIVQIAEIEEEPEPGDLQAIADGRQDFERGDFGTLNEWRHEMGLGDR